MECQSNCQRRLCQRCTDNCFAGHTEDSFQCTWFATHPAWLERWNVNNLFYGCTNNNCPFCATIKAASVHEHSLVQDIEVCTDRCNSAFPVTPDWQRRDCKSLCLMCIPLCPDCVDNRQRCATTVIHHIRLQGCNTWCKGKKECQLNCDRCGAFCFQDQTDYLFQCTWIQTHPQYQLGWNTQNMFPKCNRKICNFCGVIRAASNYPH